LFDPTDLAAELSALRGEVERLSAELTQMRARTILLAGLAQEDPLTGLLNRRGLMRDLARAAAYRARYGCPIALLLADLDGFKAVNDCHGHEAGDSALAHVGALIRNAVRACDSVGRLGGDEFALILWQASERAALSKALALEGTIAAAPLVLGRSVLPLGASIGATLIRPGDTAEEALARADAAMYARKRHKRLGGRGHRQAMMSGVS
jgi:diguanylate cyclase (GGDEF)-like protein